MVVVLILWLGIEGREVEAAKMKGIGHFLQCSQGLEEEWRRMGMRMGWSGEEMGLLGCRDWGWEVGKRALQRSFRMIWVMQTPSQGTFHVPLAAMHSMMIWKLLKLSLVSCMVIWHPLMLYAPI
uniref:Uncharacterized protein n=1 Tax=Salix viminalis TaxID=40686 RepID=A0A6N2LQ92_SALVM